MRQIDSTRLSKRGSIVLVLILFIGVGTFRGQFAKGAEEISRALSELMDKIDLNPFSSLFDSIEKGRREDAYSRNRYLKRNISGSASSNLKDLKKGSLLGENGPTPPTRDTLKGLFEEDNLKEAKLESFSYKLYFNSARVFKKNYLDDGVRATLSHQSSGVEAVISVKLAAWESKEALVELLKDECKDQSADCLKKLNILTLNELSSFPHGRQGELAGIKALRNKKTGEYRCPEFKSGKLAGYSPLHKLTVVSQTFPKDKLKNEMPKIWLPLELLEQKDKQWVWYQLEFDNPQSILFTYKPESHKDIICLPPLMQVEKIGEVGKVCTKDTECLSGCCKEGSCSPHQPSKGLFCDKEEGKSCLGHEYCHYSLEASIWAPSFNGKNCNPKNSTRGREHDLCVHNKCVPGNCRVASITYPKLSKDQCKGDIVPTEINMCVIGKDSKPVLDSKGMIQFKVVRFEE